jgi:hypothetical protein
MDCIVSGFVSVGTTPTANTTISVYVWGADTSLATTPIDVLDGTDSALSSSASSTTSHNADTAQTLDRAAARCGGGGLGKPH